MIYIFSKSLFLLKMIPIIIPESFFYNNILGFIDIASYIFVKNKSVYFYMLDN